MAQQPTRFCSNCGNPLEAGQRFCANCGVAVDANLNYPTELGPMNATAPGSVPSAPTTQASSPSSAAQIITPQLTPPPPPDVYVLNPYHSSPQSPQRYEPSVPASQPPAGNLSTQGYQATSGHQSPSSSAQAIPDFARPPRRRGSCLQRFSLLLLVLLCFGGYFTYRTFTAKNLPSRTKTNRTESSHNADTSDKTPGSVSSTQIITFTKPLTFIYADVQISIIDVKQATNFSDDPNSADQSGALRIDLKEVNTYSDYSSYYPTQAFILQLPDGTTAQPITANQSGEMPGNTSRTNWIDFAIPTNTNVSTLVLQVGQSTEAQIIVPLKANADLSKYQSKIASPNQHTQYSGTTWTVTKAEADSSFQGKQANTGKIFITVTFRIDNNSSTDFSAVPSDYIRLQSGQMTVAPTDNTVPVTFPAQETGQTATATFVMPQGSTNFTVLLLAGNNGSAYTPATQQAKIQFQIK